MGRPDAVGYHPLRTIFQEIALFDDLVVSLREFGTQLPLRTPAAGKRGAWDSERDPFTAMVEHVSGSHVVACDWADFPAESTLTKALRLASEFVILPPLRVELSKRIPAESGLGGGSSDAAALLMLLQWMGSGILDHEMFEVAKAIGADVPFFLMGGRAKAQGYGEILSRLPDLEPEWYVIARPEVGCPTGPMYKALDEKEYAWREFPEGDELYNDFEMVAPCESLDLIETLQTLGARDAGLSGSGSAVFGRFLAPDRAEAAKSFLVERLSCRAWVAKTLESRPIPV